MFKDFFDRYNLTLPFRLTCTELILFQKTFIYTNLNGPLLNNEPSTISCFEVRNAFKHFFTKFKTSLILSSVEKRICLPTQAQSELHRYTEIKNKTKNKMLFLIVFDQGRCPPGGVMNMAAAAAACECLAMAAAAMKGDTPPGPPGGPTPENIRLDPKLGCSNGRADSLSFSISASWSRFAFARRFWNHIFTWKYKIFLIY